MRTMVRAAKREAKKRKMTDDEYIQWWHIERPEPAPFGPVFERLPHGSIIHGQQHAVLLREMCMCDGMMRELEACPCHSHPPDTTTAKL